MSSISSFVEDVRERPDLAGYYVVMGIVVAVFTGLWLYEGHYLFTAWFPSLFDEITPINGVMAGAFMTLMLACSVVSLFRPGNAVGPSKVLLVGAGTLGVVLPLAFVLSEPLVTAVLLVVAGSILVLLARLHPAGSAVLPAGRGDVSYPLAGLTILVAVPFLWMAADFQWLQITLDDEVTQRWFYGGFSMYLLVVVSLMAVTSVDGTTRRFTAGAAVFLTSILGLVSIVYPSELHSLGLVGGGLLLAWCAGVAAVTFGNISLATSQTPDE